VKIWNIAVSQKNDGAKHLDLQIHGVIDGGWMDDASTSTAEIAKALAEHPTPRRSTSTSTAWAAACSAASRSTTSSKRTRRR
jgi:hypothetical protein